jgi:hypothetical protein
MEHKPEKNEQGYVMLGVIVLLALSMLLSMGMLNSASTNAKTRHVVRTQADNYYEVEETLNNVVGWLQTNSKSLVTPFMAANFAGNFDVGQPVVGDNEGQFFDVPTMVKMTGTNDSVMLSNNEFFGDSAFPAATHLDTGAAFDAVTEFENANLGGANARIVLVWARETDGNYEPVFRVDVMTGNNPDRGVHSFSYVYSALTTSNNTMNFYGRDFLTLNTGNNDCVSHQFTYDAGTSSWDRGAPRANCGVASDQTVSIASQVSGSARSNIDPGLNITGAVSGATCEGAGCHGYALPVMGDWASYCAVNNGDLSVGADLPLPNGGCWRDVDIANRKTLYLEDTTAPYYFRLLDFKSNFAEVKFGPGGIIPNGEKVTVYVETLNNDHINGNRFYNLDNAPHQVEIFYIGNTNLKLNGTADINAMITAPNAEIEILGNFNMYGGVWATSLTANGNARLFADESVAGVPVVSDMNFSLQKTSQRYR